MSDKTDKPTADTAPPANGGRGPRRVAEAPRPAPASAAPAAAAPSVTTAPPRPEAPAAAQPGGPRVAFDTSQLKSSYCNVCNGSSTREEVVLNFGVNTAWDRPGTDRLTVALHHRIVLSPHAAKRVRDMLVRLIEEHEARHGKLDP